MVIQLVVFDYFLWIELDLPEHLVQTLHLRGLFLALINDPNIEFSWIIDDFQDIEYKVSHALGTSQLLI